MDTMQGNKATMQRKRTSVIVMIQLQADCNGQASHHAAIGRKQAMPKNASRLFPHVHSRARQQDRPCPLL